MLSYMFWFSILFCDTDWVRVVWYAVVGVDDVTVVYETGFLFGNELIFGGELVTKGLNEVVFGLELTGMGFEECCFFRLQ